jgi:hypothetical protein
MGKSPQFSTSFILLQQEGHLISSCLTSGLTQLRAANVHNKGAFYGALFNLSIGLERLLKAIVIMDFMTKNKLRVPSKAQLKAFGHDIVSLYDSCITISIQEAAQLPTRGSLEATTNEILNLLNDFAQTTRYHNLDALSSAQRGKDPLTHWNEIIIEILKTDAPIEQQAKINSLASAVAESISNNTTTIMQGLDQQDLTTEQALSLPGLHDLAVKYAILRIIKVLAPIRDLISDVSHRAYALGISKPPFPQMQEFLEWIWDDKAYVLRKKRWP